MSLISEKKETIKMVEQLENIDVVRVLKRILISQQHTLEQSIQTGLKQSSNNEVIAHKDVMQPFKRKYAF